MRETTGFQSSSSALIAGTPCASANRSLPLTSIGGTMRRGELRVAARLSHEWVRTSLQQCRLLEKGECVDHDALAVIVFAIQWAPFGGADSGELLVSFGVDRRRFLQMLNAALAPRRADTWVTRGLKQHLLAALDYAWNPSRAPALLPYFSDGGQVS
ncbi:hypothetical protein [Nocardia africana]|uniref:Uncharacterized protein n=1 Tax=Nocardia africana TaxID=134964 RepID=A0ABW6NU10_9NOCA